MEGWSDFPAVQVARAVTHTKRDDDTAPWLGWRVAWRNALGEGEEVVVDIGPSARREASTHHHAVNWPPLERRGNLQHIGLRDVHVERLAAGEGRGGLQRSHPDGQLCFGHPVMARRDGPGGSAVHRVISQDTLLSTKSAQMAMASQNRQHQTGVIGGLLGERSVAENGLADRERGRRPFECGSGVAATGAGGDRRGRCAGGVDYAGAVRARDRRPDRPARR